MPNVIAIVDDPKIRGQIETLFKELDEDNIRMALFSTGYDFEQTYFAPKKAEKVHPLHRLSGFEKFNFDEIEAALTQKLTEGPALSNPSVKLRINPKSLKIEAIEPPPDQGQEILGLPSGKLKDQTDPLGSAVLPEFLTHWQHFQRRMLQGRGEILLPFKIAQKPEIAWCKVKGTVLQNDHWMLEVSDQTPNLREPLHAELARRQNQSVEEEAVELKLFSQIDLLLVKADCVPGKTQAWINQTLSHFSEFGYKPKEGPTRTVILKYEDDGISLLDMLHPQIDDLIYLPLDRLIFLQKMEIFLSLPKKIKPSYLYIQEVNLPIEISKLTKLERFSDLGLTIRNPVRLVPGLLAHFYLNLYGETKPISLWGKVIANDRHPERTGEFLVTFAFFALGKIELAAIKRQLARTGRFMPFVDSERSSFAFDPGQIGLGEEDRRVRQVGIINLDEESGLQIEKSLRRDIDNLNCARDMSITGFFNRYVGNPQFAFSGLVTVCDDGELMGSPTINFTFNPESLEMVSSLPPATESLSYFDLPASEALAKPKGWLEPLLRVPGNEELLREIVDLARGGRPISQLFTIAKANNEGRIVRVSLRPSENPALLKAEFGIPQVEELEIAKRKSERLAHLDLLIVDLAMVPRGDVNSFMAVARQKVEQARLNIVGKNLKFIFIADARQEVDPRQLDHRDIVGVVYGPADPRQISFLVAQATETQFSIYTMSNLNWQHALMPIHVARDVHLESLAEFGGAIAHSRPIAPGAVLFLRGGIFDNAPNRCLAARFYHCEPHPKEKGKFLCSLTYFGINDAFMKYARKWFMDNYAQSKQSEGGGE